MALCGIYFSSMQLYSMQFKSMQFSRMQMKQIMPLSCSLQQTHAVLGWLSHGMD